MTDNKTVLIAVEKLLQYALKHTFIQELDLIYSRNLLLDILQLDAPYENDLAQNNNATSVASILSILLEHAVASKLIENTITERDLFDTRIMNAVMPRPSEVAAKFSSLQSQKGAAHATDWFYKLNTVSEYIRQNRIDKNIRWTYQDEKYVNFEMTINLSKPEKDLEEIMKLMSMPKSGYPACMLCAENMGYAGRLDHPARQTLRLIPMTLGSEQWYMQYSPYVYFQEHCIVLNHKHTPMLVSRNTIVRMLDFVDLLPHYFIGSNAGIPIVGGSILNHDHYQGGRAVLPMAKAEIKEHFTITNYPNINAGIVHWPMNCIRLISSDRKQIIDAASHILTTWEGYSDPDYGIINNINGITHNAITPYAYKMGEDYQIDLVLRNNITAEEFPLGVFHPHPELHHIKKENIGLIEVMGLFILPGRLKTELSMIEDILSGDVLYDISTIKEDDDLQKHTHWIERLVSDNGTSMKKRDIVPLLQNEIGAICRKVLECAGVYKDTEDGHKGLMRFLEQL
ncbi:MAG: UDP-glucose--hexose-1-phosphate uridylyltransferase [Clostridiales bacterium]|nr:UDP-glucose--hexose-1-phosphate uridylyltransferase [Clostridiales bacterium]